MSRPPSEPSGTRKHCRAESHVMPRMRTTSAPPNEDFGTDTHVPKAMAHRHWKHQHHWRSRCKASLAIRGAHSRGSSRQTNRRAWASPRRGPEQMCASSIHKLARAPSQPAKRNTSAPIVGAGVRVPKNVNVPAPSLPPRARKRLTENPDRHHAQPLVQPGRQLVPEREH